MKVKQNIEENIFKLISQPPRSSYFLNKSLLNIYPSQCYFKESGDYMIKYFKNSTLYEWELYVYNKIKDHNLTIEIIEVNTDNIIYNTKGKTLLRVMLKQFENEQKIGKIHLFVNELLCFVRTLTNFGIVLENICIDNIYVQDISNTFRFFLIDFTQLNLIKSRQVQDNNSSDDVDTAVKMLYESILKEKKWINNPIIKYLNNQLKTSFDFLDYYIN